MTIPVIDAQDSSNPRNITPNMLACGYDTGTPGQTWAAENGFAMHTKPYPAIHIDQDPNANDDTADIYDVETGALGIDVNLIEKLVNARANFRTGKRPGQRWPGVYLALGNLDPAVRLLQLHNLTNVPFWTAEPGNTRAHAIARVTSATGPYPCIGCQYSFDAAVDLNVFSLDWVTRVSVKPGSMQQGGWAWCNKCQGLFYAPHTMSSTCPVGGLHDPSESGNYTLNMLPR